MENLKNCWVRYKLKICWDNLERAVFSINGDFRIGRDYYVEMNSCKLCKDPYLTYKYNQGRFCSIPCARKYLSMYGIKRRGSLSNNYKGGVAKAGLTTYTANKDILGIYEDVRKQNNTEVLEVKCAYCGQWFSPTSVTVNARIAAINKMNHGECRLYCSDNCKQSCPTYKQRTYPKGFKHATSREVSTYLRQMVLERDGWICQICGNTIEKAPLHVHHMDPVVQNPLFQNDMDSCITLCKSCHKKVHRQYGCRYVDLQCKREG